MDYMTNTHAGRIFEQGVQQGIEQGIQQNTLSTILNMLEYFTNEQIAIAVKKTAQEIARIRGEYA